MTETSVHPGAPSPTDETGPIAVQRVEPPTLSQGGVVTSSIPQFFARSSSISAAGIVFHAGRGFEVAAASGVTHLIKHMIAAHTHIEAHGPHDPYLHDATGFSFIGAPDDLVDCLAELTLALSVIPLEQLNAARETVNIESRGWRPSLVDQLMRVRYGIQGPGSSCLEEYGVRKVGEKQLTNWTNRYFHRDNAAIWHVGPEPLTFRTRLVHGVKPLSPPPPLTVPTPGAIYGNEGEVCLSVLVPRDLASDAVAHVAELRATTELVTKRGISSTVIFSAERRTPWVSEIVGYANAAAGHDDEVARVMLWALDSIRHEPTTEEELNSYRAAASAPYFDHQDIANFAMEHAVSFLAKTPVPTWAEQYHALTQLTPEQLAETTADGMSTLLIAGSRDCSVLSERFVYVGGWSPGNVEGAHVKPIPLPDEVEMDRSLVFGPLGLVVRERDHVNAVRFSDCSLMLRDEGTYRELISSTGNRAVFIAEAWENGARMLSILDREVPIERTITFDELTDTRGGYIGIERRRWPR